MYQKFRLKETIACLVLLGLSACGGNKPAGETATDTSATHAAAAPVADTVSAPAKATDFLRSLPSPLHVARLFKRSGLKYIGGISNPADNASKYQSVNSQSLNLGVYSADLAYAALNNQNQPAISYFKSVRTLGDKLNLSSIFEQDNLMSRFEKNIGNTDSLVLLMAELHMQSDMLLKSVDRHDVIFLSFAGAWVESLYIATHLTKSGGDAKTTSKIKERVLDQAAPLNSLIKLLTEYKQKQEFESLITGLTGIRDAMTEISDLHKPADDKEYQEKYNKVLYPKVEELRKQIVNGF